MDTEKLKAALQQMIMGGSMTPAAKSGQSTLPPASSSDPQLWGADLKRRLKVLMQLLFSYDCMLLGFRVMNLTRVECAMGRSCSSALMTCCPENVSHSCLQARLSRKSL